MNKAVFFDRDGVLNQAVIINGRPHPPEDAEHLVIQPGAAECVARVRKAGFLCICVTNQPDIARKTRTAENVDAMNDKIMHGLALDDLYCCPHDNADHCECRKPKPGMLISAAKKWNIDLSRSWMIGDRRGDVLAGQKAGCKTIFLDGGYEDITGVNPDFICAALVMAAQLILAHNMQGEKQ